MPELPEVETVKRFLEAKVLNQKIVSLDVLNDKSFDGDVSDVVGQKITHFKRQGKQLSAYLSNGLILLFHLKMTGQLILVPLSSKREAPTKVGEGDFVLGHPTPDMFTQPLPNKSTRVVFHFSNVILYFNDQRKFGWIKVFSPDALKLFQHDLGVDILDPEFTLDYFQNQLSQTSRPIKLVILDQSRFAGIGNIYANDSLFLAKIHPQTSARLATPAKSEKLYHAIIKVIQDSIINGGSTMRDKKYVRPDGTFGNNQFHFHVYQRSGEPCSICGTKIVRISLGARGTFFCSKCQKIDNS